MGGFEGSCQRRTTLATSLSSYLTDYKMSLQDLEDILKSESVVYDYDYSNHEEYILGYEKVRYKIRSLWVRASSSLSVHGCLLSCCHLVCNSM